MSNIPESVQLGKNTVIEEDVVVGENVVIGHNTVLLQGTHIGDDVSIGSNCVLGIKPGVNQRMRKTAQDNQNLMIESGTRIGHLVSIYSGTKIGKGVFIGDQASIRENVSVGPDSVIGRAAIVELNTTIGKSCTIQTLAYVTGDTTLEDEVFIGPCVSMSNDKYMGAQPFSLKGPHIRKGAKIGNNASLLPGVTIGKDTIVGAGSVVTKNIEENIVVAGIPARKIRS
ncbi:N-acetyltransferase [Radiobacillus kanasensis]|uniref:DapH/DapD/GlmU-related protein n=1 Tax=Radiobacillus kanasensis TaxID=2844358 RepID=UPI001E4C4106|nr:DapH/DapD/GlmU-related protein [Radiobacillus kanasensis]UFU00036.1 N-acetyltransferase [Radiobacillus kanasensis]